MEKKLYLWISLIFGVPAIRLVEVFSVARATSGFSQVEVARHAALGIIIGVGCALAAKMLRLEGRRLVLLPVLALGYATLLLGVTYPRSLFQMDSSFVMSLIMMDLVSWAVAVGGATMIGSITMRPRQPRPLRGAAIPR